MRHGEGGAGASDLGDGSAGGGGFFGEGGGLVVAEDGDEGGGEHEAGFDEFGAAGGGADAVDAVPGEVHARVGQQGDGFVEEVGGQGQGHGQFEIALGGGGGEGGVVADNALADHEEGFGDDGVDLAGHDSREPGWTAGRVISPRPAREGRRPSRRMSLAILVRETAIDFQRGGHCHERSRRRLGRKMAPAVSVNTFVVSAAPPPTVKRMSV